MGVADHLLALVGDEVGPHQGRQAQHLGVAGVDVAAGDVEVARDRHQADKGPRRLEGLRVVLDGVAPLDGCGLRRGVGPGGPADEVGRHPGDAGDLLGRVLFYVGRKLVEAVGPFLHELPVIQALLDDHVEEAQGERRIRAGPKLQPVLRLPGQVDAPRVDDDDLGAVLDLLHEHAADLTLLVGGGDVAAPEDDELALVVQVRHGVEAAGVHARNLPGRVADILGGDDVGGTEEIGQADLDEVIEPLGHAHAEGDPLGAVLFLDLEKALGDRLQGLIPRDAGPLPLAPLSDPLQGVAEPVRVVELVRRGEPLDAGVALAEEARRVPLDLDDLIVLHPHEERAAPVIHASAVRPDPSDVFCHRSSP
ncbi:MAG: hypothetical protein A4E67_00985 [Syntrophaceae bacterium PtaB.Bin038]|nr:MAG: hypothetical protein A4E67_00985 [Syntrophaceae bacterium PtaB.Bin038]